MKKYSVIIITANRHNLLKNCLDKLFEYKVDKEAEIIVVDASQSCFVYDKINEIRYIKIAPNEKGFSNQRNIGIKNASGEFVIFIDDDVEITEDWFENLTKEFENYKDKTFGAMGTLFPKQSNIINFICGVLGHPGGGFKLHNFSKNKVIFLSQVATCNTVFNKQIIEDVGMFDVNNKFGSEDSELCLRIIKKYGYNKFVYIPKAVAFHYSPDKFHKFVKWYERRGMADIDLYLRHSIHLSYVIRTSIVLKIFPFLILGAFDKKIFLFSFVLYYLWQLFKHRFMYEYFLYYNFKFYEKFCSFFMLPIFKLIADILFDYGRIKRIFNVKLKKGI